MFGKRVLDNNGDSVQAAIATTANGYLSAGDSPFQVMFNEWATVTVSDTFETYLMYKPDGADSIWVTLRKMDWFYGGKGKNTDPEVCPTWEVTDRVAPEDAPEGVDCIALPQWDDNFGNSSLQKVTGVSP